MDVTSKKKSRFDLRTLDTDYPGTVLVLCVLSILVVIGMIGGARHRSTGEQVWSGVPDWPRHLDPDFAPMTEHEKRQRAVQMMHEAEDEVLRMLDYGGE